MLIERKTHTQWKGVVNRWKRICKKRHTQIETKNEKWNEKRKPLTMAQWWKVEKECKRLCFICIDWTKERKKTFTMFLINWKLLNETTTANSSRAHTHTQTYIHTIGSLCWLKASKQWDRKWNRRNAKAIVDAPRNVVAAAQEPAASVPQHSSYI